MDDNKDGFFFNLFSGRILDTDGSTHLYVKKISSVYTESVRHLFSGGFLQYE